MMKAHEYILEVKKCKIKAQISPQQPKQIRKQKYKITARATNGEVINMANDKKLLRLIDRYDDGLQNVANGFTDLIRG
jgi:hypothetical protein